MKSREIAAIIKEDKWTVAEAGSDEAPIILRYREPLLSVHDTSGYGELLHILWSFAARNEFGLPEPDEHSEAGKFENYLCDVFEHDQHGVLALVITGNGEREFFLYTSDGQECSKRIHEMPQQEEPYPIQLTLEDDPQWKTLRVDIFGG